MFSTHNSVKAALPAEIADEDQLRSLYFRLEEYKREYYLNLQSKKNLEALYKKIIDDLECSVGINEDQLVQLPISAKWMTISVRSAGLLSTLIGVFSLFIPICFSVPVSLFIVAAYATKKSFEDVSKKEQGLKIQAALLCGKEHIFVKSGLKKPGALVAPVNVPKPSSKYSMGGAIRCGIGVVGSSLGLYRCFISLIAGSLITTNPVALGVGVGVAALVVIAYVVLSQKHKRQINEVEQNLKLSDHVNRLYECKYLEKAPYFGASNYS